MTPEERADKIQALIDATVALKEAGMEPCEICFICFNEAELTPQNFNRLMRGEDQLEEAHKLRCPACHGDGVWETECCDGSRGCTCRGQRVPMGTCNVCGGTGQVKPGANTRANLDSIAGMCYTGSGPRI